VLWGYGIKLKIVSADGGSSCRKALPQLVEDPELAHRKLIAFSDCDHLFKTLRNKLAKNHVKCNERTLNWDVIRNVWKEDVGLQGVLPVSCLDPAKDKQRSDWMRWVCHEPVVVQHLRDAAANRGEGQKDEATDLFYLAEFLHNTNKYIEAWEGKEKTDLDRFTDIYESSQFFLGGNKDFIISGLTDKAREGIMLNLASWGELAKWIARKGDKIVNEMVWGAIGTMAVENFFSKVRSVNNNPTFVQFGQIFDVVGEQFQIDRLTDKSRGWTLGDSRLKSAQKIYGKQIIEMGESFKFQWARKPKGPPKTKTQREERAKEVEEAKTYLTWLEDIMVSGNGRF
jgi:hypothetical protein